MQLIDIDDISIYAHILKDGSIINNKYKGEIEEIPDKNVAYDIPNVNYEYEGKQDFDVILFAIDFPNSESITYDIEIDDNYSREYYNEDEGDIYEAISYIREFDSFPGIICIILSMITN